MTVRLVGARREGRAHDRRAPARAARHPRAAALPACGLEPVARAPARQRDALARDRATTATPASTAIPSRSRARCSSGWRRLYGVPAEHILAGRGSDEAIDLLVRAFCRAGAGPGRRLSADLRLLLGRGADPGRGRARGAAACSADFALDAAAVIEAGQPRQARVSLLAEQPDRQPARRGVDPRASAARSRRTHSSCVDEAYIEFSGGASLASRLAEFPNLVVLRTLVEGLRARRRALRRAARLRGDRRAADAHPAAVRPARLVRRGGPAAHRGAAATAGRRPASTRCAASASVCARVSSRCAGVRQVLPVRCQLPARRSSRAPQAALAAGCAAGLLMRDLSALSAARRVACA